jgi:hypothetical protein
MAGAPAKLDHPVLLPSVLVPDEDGSTTPLDPRLDRRHDGLLVALRVAFLAEEDHRAALSDEQLAVDAQLAVLFGSGRASSGLSDNALRTSASSTRRRRARDAMERLTAREREVAPAIARGCSNGRSVPGCSRPSRRM